MRLKSGWLGIVAVLVNFLAVPDSVWCDGSRKRDSDTSRSAAIIPGSTAMCQLKCPSCRTLLAANEVEQEKQKRPELCQQECEECPRQLDEPCSFKPSSEVLSPCAKGLYCKYRHRDDNEGVCQEISKGMACIVHNRTYEHGETFSLDCRTQCSCQNGTYGCSSLCPQEHISPTGSCQHPRLVDVPNQCCREWMCDSQTAEQPPTCKPKSSEWSVCSNECGAGISTRQSNLNIYCKQETDIRICQTRSCTWKDNVLVKPYDSYYQYYYQNTMNQTGVDNALLQEGQEPRFHHLRRGHECKATNRVDSPVYFRFGPCVSRKHFRPKFCRICPHPHTKCMPALQTTVNVEFQCNSRDLEIDEDDDDIQQEESKTFDKQQIILKYVEPSVDLWVENHELLAQNWRNHSAYRSVTIPVQWTLKCFCRKVVSGLLHRVHRTDD